MLLVDSKPKMHLHEKPSEPSADIKAFHLVVQLEIRSKAAHEKQCHELRNQEDRMKHNTLNRSGHHGSFVSPPRHTEGED